MITNYFKTNKIFWIMGTLLLMIFCSLYYFAQEQEVFADYPVVFQAEYYNNMELSGDPVLERLESSVDYEWGLGSPDPVVNVDHFSARWVSNVSFEEGTYEFTVTADDGVRLYINGDLVIDKWKLQPPTTYKVQVDLSAGTHEIKMEYYENTVGASAKLSWIRIEPQSIPEVSEGNFLAKYYNNTSLSGEPVLIREESSVDYEWGYGSPNPVVNNDYFSAHWNAEITTDAGDHQFTVTADDGVRLYINGELLINKWIDQAPTTYSEVINLSAGTHTIDLEYYEKTGGATTKLSWIKLEDIISEPPPAGEFRAQYFNNTSLTGAPAVVRNEQEINHSWGSSSPDPLINNDHFSARWEGVFNFDDADYEFTITADDGVRLWVNEELLIDKWIDQAPTTYTVQSSLTSGEHTIKMEYYEKTGGATAKLSWEEIGVSEPPQPPPTGEFLAEYYNNMTLSGDPVIQRMEESINFSWGSGSPDPAVNNDNFSARWTTVQSFEEGVYEFTVTADDGVRLWVDGILLIDKWIDQAPTTYKVQRTLTSGEHTIKMEYYEKTGGATAILSWVEIIPPEPLSISPGSFSIVVLPDTQKYAESYPHIFTSQTQWIADNKAGLNIQFVLHVGDIVDNPNSTTQWLRAQNSLHLMDGVLPYFLALGNHEMPNASGRDTTNFNYYFPYSKYSALPQFGGVLESNKMDNVYYLITSGGIDFLILSLEFGPRDAVLDWANSVVETYPDRKVIMLTHDYVYDDDTIHGSSPTHIYGPDDPVYGLTDYNTGVQIWEKFVKKHSNMLFAFSGHVYRNDGAGLVVDIGENGNTVYQMLSDFQHYSNGGNGFLRFLEINPEEKFVKVRTYSPYLDQFLTSSAQEFQFDNVNFDIINPAPAIRYVEAVSKNSVHVEFTKLLDVTTSEQTANYSLSPDVNIVSAELLGDGKTVLLTTDDLTIGDYVITVNNVEDISGNSIEANSMFVFTFTDTSNLSQRISSSSDDAEEFSWGEMYLNSSDLEFVYDDHFDTDQKVGLRFNDIVIPQGATVVNAYVQFTTNELNSRETNVEIFGELVGNSSTFSTANNNISSRTKTASNILWNNIPSWSLINESGANQTTPALTAMVQEIVDLGDWQSGNSMTFLFQGSGKRVAYSYDGSPSKAPLLFVEWEN